MSIKKLEHWNPLPTGAEIGLEVEVEAQLPLDMVKDSDNIWVRTNDNSLRGDYNAEYVLGKPLSLTEALRQTQMLREYLADKNVSDTIRAGIHVHINVRDLTYNQLMSYLCLYYALEECLTEFCGYNRVGNHFCLRMCDADGHIPAIVNFFKKHDPCVFDNNNFRYASLNLCAIAKFGSVEFRAMQTYPNLEKMDEWIKVLYHLKTVAKNTGEPESIIENISGQGPAEWAMEILGDHYDLIEDQIFLDDKIIRGMRYAQDIIMFSK